MTDINLTQFTRVDLTVEQYYAAGDKFLPKAFIAIPQGAKTALEMLN
jgi:hypothetical protein